MSAASEDTIRQVGEEILRLAGKQSPSIFKRDFWNGQVMEWSMKMPEFKVEMFRFVDVLPVLDDSADVARHIQEYFCRDDQDFPAALQWGLSSLAPGSRLARIAASQIEKNVVNMAKTFIAGTDAQSALPTLKKMWKKDTAFTVDLLGEACVSEAEALSYEARYLDLIENLHGEAARWKPKPLLEHDGFGPIPRVNISIKLSSLYSQLDPAAADDSVETLKARLRPLFSRARELGVFLNLDTEHYDIKGVTFRTFCELLAEPEFADYNAGCVVQAYLRDSYDDLARLVDWARQHERTFTVRLVKGAYWDSETLHAELEGWPVPVYTDKGATDANYERLTTLLLDSSDVARPAIASHNVRSLAYAIANARSRGLSDDALEIQMLYGMAEPLKAAVRKMGFRLREYVPVGELIPGMAYLVRRLLENTSNESWLRARFADGTDTDKLLAAPVATERDGVTPAGYPTAGRPHAEPGGRFSNEAPIDFSHPESPARMTRALETVEATLPRSAPPYIDGAWRQTTRVLTSADPAAPHSVVGRAGVAEISDVDDAIASARRAFYPWRDRAPEHRAQLLTRTAALMRQQRDELAALMTLEAGKQWREADGDVCEAIDFLEYYARMAVQLQTPTRLGWQAGEHNHLSYEGIGVAAVIAPWNFPLAILTGMTSAALVTGNTVLFKPAEQTSIIGHALMELLLEAGVEPGVAQFVPGYGEEIGAHMVRHPEVDIIAFTGSLAVGLEINREAAIVRPGQRNIKRVVTELGGKNAIIVDSDADLDMAVLGTVKSAFGFQGQKCSACSRVIVLESAYDAFVERLVEATRSLTIGPARDPNNAVGPVIDAESQQRITRTIDEAVSRGVALALRQESPTGGHYVGPTIFTDVPPNDPLAQDEIFGPVLSVLRASDFDEALAIALSTRYALTGGLYSRSPLNIERARREFRVGNLYINRNTTGAIVGRQPFGGARMSGVGSKAGGPHYLLQFMHPRVITENTIRRGFAPEESTSA